MTKSNQTKQAFLLFLIKTGGEEYTLQNYAELLGVTKERARQMVKKFLQKEYVERVSWKKGYRITPLGKSKLEVANKEVL